MDQCVRALSRDLGSVPSTHTQWLTLVYVRIKWPEFVFLKNIFKNIFILQPARDASLRIKEAIFQWINPGNSSPQQEAQCPVPRAEREVKGTNTKQCEVLLFLRSGQTDHGILFFLPSAQFEIKQWTNGLKISYYSEVGQLEAKHWEGISLLQAGFSWAAAGTLLLLSLHALRINPNLQRLPKSAKSKVFQATADPRSNLGAPSLPPGALLTPPRRMDYRDFLLTVHCLKVCVIHVLILPPAPKQNLDVEALL